MSSSGSRPSDDIGRPMEMSMTPGRSMKDLRGQHLAEVTAMGKMEAPVAAARRVAPLL